VLLVDDESDSREAISMVVKQCGADVTTAGSVAEAMAWLEHSLPDVLVSDIAMPLEDGYGFIRRVRSRPAEQGGSLPAIAVTAYGSPQDQAQIEAAGFDAYIRKPIDVTALIGTISRLAEAART
jgi:CheY-like chemotaxis protein